MVTSEDIRRKARLALITRAAGADVMPGHDQLHHYWTRGNGLGLWFDSPKPWTTLVAHLTKYVGPERAKVFASKWVHEVTGMWTGEDRYRLLHGGKTRGKNPLGPG